MTLIRLLPPAQLPVGATDLIPIQQLVVGASGTVDTTGAISPASLIAPATAAALAAAVPAAVAASVAATTGLYLPLAGGTVTGAALFQGNNPVAISASWVVNTNGFGVFFKHSVSGFYNLGTSGTNFLLQSPSGGVVFSYDGTADNALFVQKPLQVSTLKNTNASIVLASANPTSMTNFGVNPSGPTGANEVYYNTFYSGGGADTVDATLAPINPATVKINTAFGGVAKGGRTALRVACGPSSAMTAGGPAPYIVGIEVFAGASYNVGGTNTGPGAIGQIIPINTVGEAKAGGTNLAVVSGFGEMNMGVDVGASAHILNGYQISRLATDGGTVGYFRAYQFMGTQPPSGATRVAVDMDYGIVWGHDHHEWSFGNTSKMIGWQAQGVGTNTGGAPIYPSNLGWGVDMWGMNVVNQAFRSTGFAIQGTGAVTIGTTSLTPSASGLTISAANNSITAVSIGTAGSGYKVGEYLYGTFGDIYSISTLTGSGVATVAIVGIGYSSTSPASQGVSGGSGTGCVLNLTWTAGNGVVVGASGQKVGFYGATPVVKAASPTVLADVITILRNLGLCT